MTSEIKNWIVRVYNKQDELIEVWKIQDRTEHEAFEEAAADVARNKDADDWSLSPTT